MSQYYTMLTTVGLAKLQNAAATGTKVDITTVAVGDGNGNPVTPSEDMTALVHQVWSGPVTRYEVDTNNPTQLVIEGYIPADVGGWTIRELGIFDAAGDLIAVGNYDATHKPAISDGLVRDLLLRTIIELGNFVGEVEIQIDPAVVLASRQWVNDELAVHDADPDAHPDKASRQWVNDSFASKDDLIRRPIVGDFGTLITTLKLSSGNAVQGFAHDPRTMEFFATQIVSDKFRLSGFTGSIDESHFGSCGWVSPSWYVDLDIDSHQALAIVYAHGERWFAANYGSAGQIILFRANENGLSDSRIVTTHDGAESGYCTVGNSPDNSTVVVEGLDADGKQVIKIFDAVDLFDTDNASDNARYQYTIETLQSPPYPLQGISVDDDMRVYIAYGDGDKSAPNFLRVYSRWGELISETDMTIGVDGTDKYEQEGINWIYAAGAPILSSCVLTGSDGANVPKIYALANDVFVAGYRHITVANPPSDIIDPSSVIFGKSFDVEYMYMSVIRFGVEAATINFYLRVNNFSVDLPSDAATKIILDMSKICDLYGFFRNILGGRYAAGIVEIFGDGVDATPVTCCITANNKTEDMPNTIVASFGEYAIQTLSGAQKAQIRASVSLRVE